MNVLKLLKACKRLSTKVGMILLFDVFFISLYCISQEYVDCLLYLSQTSRNIIYESDKNCVTTITKKMYTESIFV